MVVMMTVVLLTMLQLPTQNPDLKAPRPPVEDFEFSIQNPLPLKSKRHSS